MKTKWQGLWAQDRQGLYAGRVIKKADIPPYTRVVMRYNKFYEKGGNKPKFIFCFADSAGYEQTCVPLDYEQGTNARLYTEEEVQTIINRCACYIGGDGEYGEHLVSDFNYDL